ncbi:hypothetical protein DM02DRAFT_535665, partial [Periconia macrospinosa]
KCDQGKPKCERCINARLVCEGYPEPVAYRFHVHALATSEPQRPSPSSSLTPAAASKRDRAEAVPRRLDTQISADVTERWYFGLVLQATRGGVALHVQNISPVLTNIIPQLAYHHGAIRHALIALGASYHLYKTSGARTRATWHRPSMSSLETFILQHYTRAARELRVAIDSTKPESSTVALMCCLIFVFLENLRANHKGAAMHLQNGISILEAAVDFEKLYPPDSTQPAIHDSSTSALPLLSTGELRGLTNYMHQLEMSTGLFWTALPLRLASRIHTGPPRNGLARQLPERFTSLAEAHAARSQFSRDLTQRDTRLRGHRGDVAFWTRAEVKAEHAAMCQYAAQLAERYTRFMADEAVAPAKGTRAIVSAYTDLLLISSMRCRLELTPFRSAEHGAVQETPAFRVILEDMIRYGELLHEARKDAARTAALPAGTLDFAVEVGLVAPMYYAFVYTSDAVSRRRILKVMSHTETREGPWDAQALLKLISVMAQPEKQEGGAPVNPLRRWGGATDCMGLFTHLDISEW